MKYFVLSLFLIPTLLLGQFHTGLSRSEIGPMVTGSYYLGDLNPFMQFRNTHLGGGLVYRYNIHSRLAFRMNALYGKVSASDAQSSQEILRNRNLSFESDIYELAAGVEFHYFPFQLGHDRYRGTAYLLAQIAGFRMNPKTEYNGEMVALQQIGTEGQGTGLSGRGPYSLYQFSVPLGVGAKLSLSDFVGLSVEFGIRKTFTDYLDDVGSGVYVERGDLLASNGLTAANLSNRSLDGSPYGVRGNEATKDWYVFFGGMLTFRMGKYRKCWNPN